MVDPRLDVVRSDPRFARLLASVNLAAVSRPEPLSGRYASPQSEIQRFAVRDAEEGAFTRALGHGIFTQGETWEELRANVLEAATLHFEHSSEQPRLIQLHYVKDELIPVEAA